MSKATAKLLGEKLGPTGNWPRRLGRVTRLLIEQYGVERLGNYEDPVKEIFFIVLSARTSERLYVRAMDRLFERYPTCPLLAEAAPEAVLECIQGAGLGRKRCSQVIRIAQRISEDFGDDASANLRSMSNEAVFAYLTSLPGVGPKSALCVMMWSLNRDVLPVDVNVQRIAARLGAIPTGLKHYQAQKQLPQYVPRGKSLELHTAFMIHGRKVCLPRKPKCGQCVVWRQCETGRKNLGSRN